MGQQGSLCAETDTPEVSTYTQLSHKQWAGPKHHSWKLCTQVTTHVHSHSRTQEAVTLWLTFSTNDSVFCFTYFQLTEFWKGQGGTAGPNTVCITLISLSKRNDWDFCDHPLGEDECNSGALMSKRFDSESTSISCWSYDFGKTYWISAASLMKKRK